MRRKLIAFVVGVVWLGAVAWGIHATMSYESTPGKTATTPRVQLASHESKWSIVMVAHPMCPCTAASLKALKAVVAEHRDAVECKVVFVGGRPESVSQNMQLADQIGTASIEWVSEEEAAESYGAFTSGQTFVYGPEGDIAFSGGITPGRGVDQPQFAVKLFRSLFAGKAAGSSVPVYGCGLQTEAR